MGIVVEVGKSEQPLAVGEAGTTPANGVVRGDVYLRGAGEGQGYTPSALVVDAPVARNIREQEFEVEVLKHVVDKNELRILENVVPNKLVVEYIGAFAGNVGGGHNTAHQLTNQGLTRSAVRVAYLGLLAVHADNGFGYVIILSLHSHVSDGAQFAEQVDAVFIVLFRIDLIRLLAPGEIAGIDKELKIMRFFPLLGKRIFVLSAG